MKKSILNELKIKSLAELKKTLAEYQDEAEKISIRIKAGKLKDVMLLLKMKKIIAQILTILKEKELIKT